MKMPSDEIIIKAYDVTKDFCKETLYPMFKEETGSHENAIISIMATLGTVGMTIEKMNYEGRELTTLSVMHNYDGELWVKRLYAYDGYLLESFTLYQDEETGEAVEFVPEQGEKMCELLQFEPAMEGSLLTVQLETKDHRPEIVRMYMRSGGGEE